MNGAILREIADDVIEVKNKDEKLDWFDRLTLVGAVDYMYDYADTVEYLSESNERLKRLVRDLYPFARCAASARWLDERRKTMEELGIEVG